MKPFFNRAVVSVNNYTRFLIISLYSFVFTSVKNQRSWNGDADPPALKTSFVLRHQKEETKALKQRRASFIALIVHGKPRQPPMPKSYTRQTGLICFLTIQHPTCIVPHVLLKPRKEKAIRESKEWCLYSAECVLKQSPAPENIHSPSTIFTHLQYGSYAGNRLTVTGRFKTGEKNKQQANPILNCPI